MWFVAHDRYIWKILGQESVNYYEDIISNDFLKTSVKGLIVMSEWHKETNIGLWPEEKMYILGNGLNFEDFDNDLIENTQRDNNIFWSSCYERGFDILADHIAPRIIKTIPDFKLYYASYDLIDEYNKYKDYPYIECLGNLNKKDLYKEMCKHKVTFLPMSKWETFCISILEQGYCKTEIVCPYSTGIKTTMKIFKELLLPENIEYNDEGFDYMAQMIIQKMLNYDNYYTKIIRQIIHNNIETNYSWDNITNKLIEIIL